MKKNLQLTALAFAIFCFGLNAQNSKKRVITGKTSGINSSNQIHTGHSEKTEAPGRNCGTETPHSEWETWSPEKLAQVEKANEELMQNYKSGNKQMVQYTIPVVFHIIHTGTAPGASVNISQAQIADQLTILNNDFKSAGLNNALCPATFTAVKADAEITFCLATKNPTGGVLAEPVIDRRP